MRFDGAERRKEDEEADDGRRIDRKTRAGLERAGTVGGGTEKRSFEGSARRGDDRSVRGVVSGDLRRLGVGGGAPFAARNDSVFERFGRRRAQPPLPSANLGLENVRSRFLFRRAPLASDRRGVLGGARALLDSVLDVRGDRGEESGVRAKRRRFRSIRTFGRNVLETVRRNGRVRPGRDGGVLRPTQRRYRLEMFRVGGVVRVSGALRLGVQRDGARRFVRVYVERSGRRGGRGADRITVEDTAKKFGFTCNYFGKKFYKRLGVSFNDYINNMRLNYAYSLIVDNEKTIEEIAATCGFSSRTYFSTMFRKKFGITPIECQKKHQKSVE